MHGKAFETKTGHAQYHHTAATYKTAPHNVPGQATPRPAWQQRLTSTALM
jgi:hypothetical protein